HGYVLLAQRFAVSALARDAAQVISIAGAIDDLPIRPKEHKRRHGADGWLVEVREGRLRPSGLHLGVVVEYLDDGAAARPNPRVRRRRKATGSLMPHDAYPGKRL